MPHSTQHMVHEPDASDNVTAMQESLIQPNGSDRTYRGKFQQLSHAPDRLGTYELGGTPVYKRSSALLTQSEPQKMATILFENKRNRAEAVIWSYHFDNISHFHPNDATPKEQDKPTVTLSEAKTDLEIALPGAQDAQLATTAAQERLAKSPPTTIPDPLSYDDFIQLLRDEGLTWLLKYIDQLNSIADFAVAPTANPNKKRCKVGRPRGKILKREQNDDLARRLCCLHLDAAGFQIQVEGQHRDPWTCWPPNADEDVDVAVE